jgi:sec-independent protein translocase protein TatB
MLDFGFSEILLTSAIALVVLGPERLPKVARQVGNWMGRARLMARQLSEQLEREVNAEELLREQMKTPLRADPPSRPEPVMAPASLPMMPPAPAEASPAGEAAAASPWSPRLPEDGHATTAAAMHAPPPTPAGPDPQTSNQ